MSCGVIINSFHPQTVNSLGPEHNSSNAGTFNPLSLYARSTYRKLSLIVRVEAVSAVDSVEGIGASVEPLPPNG